MEPGCPNSEMTFMCFRLCMLLARGLNSELSQRDEELAGLRKELQDLKERSLRKMWLHMGLRDHGC